MVFLPGDFMSNIIHTMGQCVQMSSFTYPTHLMAPTWKINKQTTCGFQNMREQRKGKDDASQFYLNPCVLMLKEIIL